MYNTILVELVIATKIETIITSSVIRLVYKMAAIIVYVTEADVIAVSESEHGNKSLDWPCRCRQMWCKDTQRLQRN